MVSNHVDDFILALTEKFLEEITSKIAQKLEISKLEDNEFRFTGIVFKGCNSCEQGRLCKEFGKDRDKERNA